MKITISDIIKQEILKNLIDTHERLSEKATDIKGIIKLSKFILAISKNMNDKTIEFDFIKTVQKKAAEKPPTT